MIYYTLSDDTTQLTVHDSYDLNDIETHQIQLDLDDVKSVISNLTFFLGQMTSSETKYEIRALKNERARIESRLAQLGAL